MFRIKLPHDVVWFLIVVQIIAPPVELLSKPDIYIYIERWVLNTLKLLHIEILDNSVDDLVKPRKCSRCVVYNKSHVASISMEDVAWEDKAD